MEERSNGRQKKMKVQATQIEGFSETMALRRLLR
jgi:hypothetical protein